MNTLKNKQNFRPSIAAKDKDLLLKILRMTESSHDAEAINALRKAQKILCEYQMNLGDLFSGHPFRVEFLQNIILMTFLTVLLTKRKAAKNLKMNIISSRDILSPFIDMRTQRSKREKSGIA